MSWPGRGGGRPTPHPWGHTCRDAGGQGARLAGASPAGHLCCQETGPGHLSCQGPPPPGGSHPLARSLTRWGTHPRRHSGPGEPAWGSHPLDAVLLGLLGVALSVVNRLWGGRWAILAPVSRWENRGLLPSFTTAALTPGSLCPPGHARPGAVRLVAVTAGDGAIASSGWGATDAVQQPRVPRNVPHNHEWPGPVCQKMEKPPRSSPSGSGEWGPGCLGGHWGPGAVRRRRGEGRVWCRASSRAGSCDMWRPCRAGSVTIGVSVPAVCGQKPDPMCFPDER